MIDEVRPGIFRMEIPLPANPLKAINSYVIKGEDRFLMIDTGMNRPECLEAMDASLKELRVDLEKTDFFVTHLHADHLGLISELSRPSSKVYFNFPDAEVVREAGHWEKMAEAALLNGFPEKDLQEAIKRHPGRRYHANGPLDLTLLKEGDPVRIGPYRFSCVETPGHTPGHLCLYEKQTRIFFSGDHILDDITPNISVWSERQDPLSQYLKSLDKIVPYEIDWVLPGHRTPFQNHRRRIAELKEHHEIRTEEVASILRRGSRTAYQVASEMTWDIDCETWEDFPLPQKWFAGGEAMAHLKFLQGLGRVIREQKDGRYFFRLAEQR
jgi:glyoxylase-like metal-dependent hydrolase (beta-lactamase superfamily II)